MWQFWEATLKLFTVSSDLGPPLWPTKQTFGLRYYGYHFWWRNHHSRILFNKKPPYLDIQNGGEKNTWSAMFREKCMAFYHSHIPFRIAQSWRVNHGELIHHGRGLVTHHLEPSWLIKWLLMANIVASQVLSGFIMANIMKFTVIKNIILPHTMTISLAILGVSLRHTIEAVPGGAPES